MDGLEAYNVYVPSSAEVACEIRLVDCGLPAGKAMLGAVDLPLFCC